MRFRYTVHHCPGKSLYLADALSRAPVKCPPEEVDTVVEREAEKYLQAVISSIPANEDRLDVYQQAQAEDTECSKLIDFCKSGWPKKAKGEIKRFWQARGKLTYSKGLLLHGARIVVPKKLQKETLEKIHSGHQGILRCRLRVSESVWWPGVLNEVDQFIKTCPECQKATVPSKEPLLPSTLPDHPWEKVAADLFELNKATYLLVVDYFSRYVEIQKLNTTTASRVIAVLKAIFARHGVPSQFVSDNGPLFDCFVMKVFAETYGFRHITSRPYYPQSNGLAERAVKTVKQLLQTAPDPHMALLSYRATPLPSCRLSPTELLMGRRNPDRRSATKEVAHTRLAIPGRFQKNRRTPQAEPKA